MEACLSSIKRRKKVEGEKKRGQGRRGEVTCEAGSQSPMDSRATSVLVAPWFLDFLAFKPVAHTFVSCS